jgi:Holliday junction resolvase
MPIFPTGRKKGGRKMINSKKKGKRGELELARKLREFGYDCRRGQQYSGIAGDDVVGLPYIHIECKRQERLNVYEAIRQAQRDAKEDEKPAVFWRRNREEWLVVMRLEDWIELYREWESGLYIKEAGD